MCFFEVVGFEEVVSQLTFKTLENLFQPNLLKKTKVNAAKA